MGKLSKFIKIFDIYSNYFQLRINDQKKFKTFAGGLLSLFTIIILVICILNFGADFFNRKSPKVVIEEGLYLNDLPELNGTEYVNRTIILEVEKFFIDYNKMFIRNNMTNFFPDVCPIEVTDSLDVDRENYSYFCINLNEYVLGNIMINFISCSALPPPILKDFERRNIKCNTDNTTSMKSVRMGILVPELGFKPDEKYPFIQKISYHMLVFNSFFRTVLNFPINLYYLDDDIGWLTKNVISILDIDMSTREYEYIAAEELPNFPIVKISLTINSKFKKYSRTYVKFQEFLAIIGGFMKLVISLLNIILMFAKTYLIDLHIMYSQFSDKLSVEKSPSCDKTLNHSNQSNKNINKELVNNFVELKIAGTRTDQASKEFNSPSNVTLFKYTKAAVFNMLNCKGSKKGDGEIDRLRNKLKAVDKLQDYDMLLKKVNELEVIKKILFTETQILCFEFLEKPCCISNEENMLSSLLVTQQDKKRDTLVNNFAKLVSEETLNGIDEKFFKVLDDDIKEKVFKKLNT
jgi:hypothetical protein